MDFAKDAATILWVGVLVLFVYTQQKVTDIFGKFCIESILYKDRLTTFRNNLEINH